MPGPHWEILSAVSGGAAALAAAAAYYRKKRPGPPAEGAVSAQEGSPSHTEQRLDTGSDAVSDPSVPQVLAVEPAVDPAWEQPPAFPAKLPRYVDRKHGRVYECRQLEGHLTVVATAHPDPEQPVGLYPTEGDAGDWLCHSGSTGVRFVVPASEFATRFVRLMEDV